MIRFKLSLNYMYHNTDTLIQDTIAGNYIYIDYGMKTIIIDNKIVPWKWQEVNVIRFANDNGYINTITIDQKSPIKPTLIDFLGNIDSLRHE